MANEGVSDERDTLESLLSRTKRTAIPVRVAFVHHPSKGGGPGPLRAFLRRIDTLDLYLLLIAVAVKAPFTARFPAAVWARALGREGKGGELWVSKSLRWLEDEGLITRARVGRETAVTLREDSERDAPYSRPDGKGEWNRFINLSHTYFLAEHHKRLSGPGKAVLLIALSNRREFELPMRQGERWWGISAETLSRGLDELQQHGLLSSRSIKKRAPMTRLGFTLVSLYTLRPPFAKTARTVTPVPARRPRMAQEVRRRGLPERRSR